MRRFTLISLTSCTAMSVATAQFPPTNNRDPAKLPPGISAPKSPESPKTSQDATPSVGRDGLPVQRPDVPLKRVERVKPLGKLDVRIDRNNWQVWAGANVFANFGADWKAAEKTAGTLQAMQTGTSEKGTATIAEIQDSGWATLGETRPQVGYMISRGEAVRSFKGAINTAIPVDLATVRAEEVRGVWVVRDNQTILLNFGDERIEAEQTVAVALRYGFNRIGYVGSKDAPSLRYFFAAQDANVMKNPNLQPASNAVTTALQEASLDRAGVEIPGFGFAGQKVNLDMRKMEVRKDGSEFVLVHAGDVFAKFGRDEWNARDALRVLREMKPTAIVRIGSPGITFFLKGNEVANRLPFGMVGTPFDGDKLKPHQTVDGIVHIYDPINREIASVKSQKEADAVRAAIKHFQLNRTCQIGNATANSLQFMGRSN